MPGSYYGASLAAYERRSVLVTRLINTVHLFMDNKTLVDKPSHSEVDQITASLRALDNSSVVFFRPARLSRLLRERRDGSRPTSHVRESSALYSTRSDTKPRIVPPQQPRAWDIGFSDDFWKTLEGLAPKESKRVLKAMREISREPLTLKGDTIKPLNSNLKGLWRVRLGDARLIYRPEKEFQRIFILSYENRGDVYK